MKDIIKNDKRQTIGYIEKTGTKITVYDVTQRRVGEIKSESGKLVAYDSHLKRVADYEERTDITRDSRLYKVGKGNLLVQILLQNSNKTEKESIKLANTTGKEPIKNANRQTIGYAEKSGKNIVIYDNMRRKVGEIRPEYGKQVAYDSHSRRIAVFEERLNITKDSRLITIGKGNLLVDILLQNK